MGKILSKTSENEENNETKLQNYEDLSVVEEDDKFLQYIDPRSPSAAINRTPINVSVKSFLFI